MKNIKPKRICLIIIGTALCVVVIFAILAIALIHTVKSPIYNRMFINLEELQKLEQYSVDEETPKDNDLGELTFEKSYSTSVSFDDHIYHVYAYVFVDDISAKQYFKSVSGAESRFSGCAYMSGNIFRTVYVVYYHNCLYKVYCKFNQDVAGFINWLNSSFPIDIDALILEEPVSEG